MPSQGPALINFRLKPWSSAPHSIQFPVCCFMQMFFLLLLPGRDSRCRCCVCCFGFAFGFIGKHAKQTKLALLSVFLHESFPSGLFVHILITRLWLGSICGGAWHSATLRHSCRHPKGSFSFSLPQEVDISGMRVRGRVERVRKCLLCGQRIFRVFVYSSASSKRNFCRGISIADCHTRAPKWHSCSDNLMDKLGAVSPFIWGNKNQLHLTRSQEKKSALQSYT